MLRHESTGAVKKSVIQGVKVSKVAPLRGAECVVEACQHHVAPDGLRGVIKVAPLRGAGWVVTSSKRQKSVASFFGKWLWVALSC